MAAELTNYVLQERPIQPMIDLGIMQNTLATITAGNKEALQRQSELQTAIANLDLNEAEDGYKQQLYDDISKTIDDNSVEGNAYYALNKLIETQGNIGKNQSLIGRLKAQEAYKKYQAELDERALRGDISFDTAAWAKEMNPYHYKDTYKLDENGNPVVGENGSPIVIGGTRWTPDFQPVKDIDFNEVLKLAAQYATPDAGGGTAVSFLGADGKPTSDPTNAVGILNETTGVWEKLSPEKLKAGIQAAMAANPQYEASLRQGYKVLEWKWEKGNKNTPLFDPKTGDKKSFEDYIDDMINPFLRARSYTHYKSSTQYHDAAFTALNKTRQNNYNRMFDSNGDSLSSTQGYDAKWKDTTRQDAVFRVDSVTNLIRDNISKLDPDGKININAIDITNPESITNALKKAGISDDKINTVIEESQHLIADNQDYFNYYNQMVSQKTKGGAAMLMNSKISSGSDVEESELKDNPYLQKFNDEYKNIISNCFGGANNFGYSVTKKEYDRLISRLGINEASVKALGYNIQQQGDRYVISIDKNHINLFSQFMDAVNATHDETSTWSKNVSHRDRLIRFNDNLNDAQTAVTTGSDTYGSSHYGLVHQYNSFKNKMVKLQEQEANVPENRIVSTTNVGGLTPDQYDAWERYLSASNSTDRNNAKGELEAIDSYLETILNPASFVNSRIYMVDPKTNSLVEMDSSQKRILGELINGNAKILEKNMNYNIAEGMVTPELTYRIPKGEKNPFNDAKAITFTTEKLINDPKIREINGSDDFKSNSTLFKNDVNGMNTDIGYYKDNSTGRYIHYQLSPVKYNSDGINYRELTLDNGNIVSSYIPPEQATHLLTLFNQAREVMQIPPINEEYAKIIADFTSSFINDPLVNKYFGKDIARGMLSSYIR